MMRDHPYPPTTDELNLLLFECVLLGNVHGESYHAHMHSSAQL